MSEEARLTSFIANKARQAASLQEDDTKAPRSEDRSRQFAASPFSSQGESGVDRVEPPKDEYRRYWRQFETTPIVREPITSYAREVVQPGYRVESPDLDEEELKQLINWLRKSAVVGGLTDENMTELIKKAVVQLEVKGTVFIEKVPAKEDEEVLMGFKFIPAETVEINKRPNQNIVLQPGDEDEFEDVPTNEDGVAAAYTQTRAARSRYEGSGAGASSGGDTINFTVDEVIKITRDEDTSEALGTSRLESVSQRIEGLKNKLRDNDEAISSKAYPLWLFLFGQEDAPWDRDDIDSFMRAHEMDNFHPGMKQGVRGDVSVETISGEVADIAEFLEFDLNWILTAMPKAKYTLGAFESSINQFVTQSQERDTQTQIQEVRREFESKITPAVQQKAMELFGLGEEEAENLRFKLGAPDEEQVMSQPNVNVIRYIGGDTETVGGNQQNPQGQQNPNASRQDVDAPEDESADNDGGDDTNTASEQGKAIWEAELSQSQAELASDAFADEREDLEQVVERVITDFRDDVLTELERKYQNSPQSGLASFDSMANSQVDSKIRGARLQEKSNAIMESTVRGTLEELGEGSEELAMDVPFNFRHRQQAQGYSQNVVQSTRDALHEFVRRMRVQLQRAVNAGEGLEPAVSRICNNFTDAQLSQRARIIAHMSLHNAKESAKLNEFSMNDNIVAVRPVNSCGPNTTPVCANLCGCGNRRTAVARLDEDLSDQWQEQVADDLTHQGFDPVPANPPWHFGCKTELMPVTEAELEEYEPKKGGSYTVEELEDKYGIEVDYDAN